MARETRKEKYRLHSISIPAGFDDGRIRTVSISPEIPPWNPCGRHSQEFSFPISRESTLASVGYRWNATVVTPSTSRSRKHVRYYFCQRREITTRWRSPSFLCTGDGNTGYSVRRHDPRRANFPHSGIRSGVPSTGIPVKVARYLSRNWQLSG